MREKESEGLQQLSLPHSKLTRLQTLALEPTIGAWSDRKKMGENERGKERESTHEV